MSLNAGLKQTLNEIRFVTASGVYQGPGLGDLIEQAINDNPLDVHTGSAAPSDPPGVPGSPGELYLRDAPGPAGGELWIKKGDLDTDWQMIGSAGVVNTVLSGPVPPTTEGTNGDFYIDTATETIYGPRAGGVWPPGVPMVGAAGAAGATGAGGPPGNMVLSGPVPPTPADGRDGDFYIDTSAGMLYGPKVLGAWGSPTSMGRFSNVVEVNAPTYDVQPTDDVVLVAYTPTNPVVVTLKTSEVLKRGRTVDVKDAGGRAGTNFITVATEGPETIDGRDTAVVVVDYDSYTFVSNGANWLIV